jgi:hypothetical protein
MQLTESQHNAMQSSPTKDGWYTIWEWDLYEREGKYYSSAYYFTELKQWSKCGFPNKCVIQPYAWLDVRDGNVNH